MAVDRAKVRWGPNPTRTQTWLLIGGLAAAIVVVLLSPLLMVRLSLNGLPWGELADVGQAYGGASALLSAAALCGVGASLLFQRRQIRQELADIDRQQHMDLLRLAIENPEFIEVLDKDTALNPHGRQELYANLTMMYWLAVWQLGEVDDDELRGMSAGMFRSEITRSWWARVGSIWIGTRGKPERRRFVSIVSDELTKAELEARTSTAGRPAASDAQRARKLARPTRHRVLILAAASVAAGASIAAIRCVRNAPRRT